MLQLCINERGTRIYKDIRLYSHSWRWYLCGAEEQFREFAHTKGSSGVGRASEELTLAKIREIIQSTSPTWPAPILLFHWLWLRPLLTSLFSIDYSSPTCVTCSPLATCPSPFSGCFPVDTSMDGRIFHHSPSSTLSIGQGDISIITFLILSLAGWRCQQHPTIQ